MEKRNNETRKAHLGFRFPSSFPGYHPDLVPCIEIRATFGGFCVHNFELEMELGRVSVHRVMPKGNSGK